MRHQALKPLSKEHHLGLTLCWKIRQGVRKNVSSSRIERYCKWYYKVYLEFHFEEEERYVFPILGVSNEKVKKAIAQHNRLKRLFNEPKYSEKTISNIEEELELHIRFEERILFNEIQKQANAYQLQEIEENLKEVTFVEQSMDEFWID